MLGREALTCRYEPVCNQLNEAGRQEKKRLNTHTGLVIQAVHSVPEVVELLSAKENYLE